MYEHCKKTEDKDMTAFDFITDHLLNIDGIFDKHDNGDEQKPHSPVQYNHTQTLTNFITQKIAISVIKPNSSKSKFPIYTDNFYLSDYCPSVFRPPIV